MIELADIHSSKLRFVFGSILIIASLVFLSVMISTAKSNNMVFALPGLESETVSDENSEINSSSNIVAASMASMASGTVRTIDSVEHTLTSGFKSVTATVARASKPVISTSVWGGKFVAFNSYRGIKFAATGLGNGIVFIVQVPYKVIGFTANKLSANSIVTPAYNSEVPVIDTQLAEIYVNNPTVTLEESSSQTIDQTNTLASWPIHGRVTTKFGVPHWPYQKTHTGLDISSDRSSGITPIKPFTAGKILNVVYSKVGLGNHVVVDHGEGLTSVYAHLSSISVIGGQVVDSTSIIGYEGSTGVSTGTHLHFEIRLNGQPMDPQQYIAGQP